MPLGEFTVKEEGKRGYRRKLSTEGLEHIYCTTQAQYATNRDEGFICNCFQRGTVTSPPTRWVIVCFALAVLIALA